jgi:hypothetical protein
MPLPEDDVPHAVCERLLASFSIVQWTRVQISRGKILARASGGLEMNDMLFQLVRVDVLFGQDFTSH